MISQAPVGRLPLVNQITWVRSPSLADDFERLRLRPTSLFEHMSEEEVEVGFARIEAALPTLDDGPQFETSRSRRVRSLGVA